MFGLTPYRRNQYITGKNDKPADFENFIENFFNEPFGFPFRSYFSESGQMKVDIREEEKEYIVEAELPGVEKNEINIDLSNNQLTIAVQRDEQVNDERDNYICRERRSSSFSRSFFVENVKNEGVTAMFENGLLTVKLPKIDEGTSFKRKIDIQ